jgi:cell division protein FtsB
MDQTITNGNHRSRAFYRSRACWIVTAVVLAVGLEGVFGAHGVLAMLRLKREVSQTRQQLQKLNEENGKLANQVRALKSDPETIERLAREQLGLARPGELIFKLPSKNSPPAPAKPANPPAAGSPAAPPGH